MVMQLDNEQINLTNIFKENLILKNLTIDGDDAGLGEDDGDLSSLIKACIWVWTGIVTSCSEKFK